MVAKEAELVEEEPTAIARRETRALEVAPGQSRASIEDMIMKAMEMDKPELIDKFVAIYKEQETERKKTAFAAAMARAQAKMVPVANNARNTHTNSRYAKLAAINKMAVPIYGAEGLAVSFKTGIAQDPKERRTIAVVSHEAGYVDDTFYVDLPLDDKGSAGTTNKTQLHATKSTSTYAKNILVCMIFNIATEDDPGDDDGNAGGGRISPQEARKAKAPVSQPRQTPSAQKASEPKEKVQLEPAASEEEALDAATQKGLAQAMAKATLTEDDFLKRFAPLTGLDQVKRTDARTIMSWIADPVRK